MKRYGMNDIGVHFERLKRIGFCQRKSLASHTNAFAIFQWHMANIAQNILRATHIVVSSFARETVSSMRFPKLSSIGCRKHWALCDFVHATSLNAVHLQNISKHGERLPVSFSSPVLPGWRVRLNEQWHEKSYQVNMFDLHKRIKLES